MYHFWLDYLSSSIFSSFFSFSFFFFGWGWGVYLFNTYKVISGMVSLLELIELSCGIELFLKGEKKKGGRERKA